MNAPQAQRAPALRASTACLSLRANSACQSTRASSLRCRLKLVATHRLNAIDAVAQGTLRDLLLVHFERQALRFSEGSSSLDCRKYLMYSDLREASRAGNAALR
jgi:hypothetical protein